MFSYCVSIEERLGKLQRLISEGDHCIALVVAAADFERTMRRAIVALSIEPTADVRGRIEKKFNTIGKYHQAWHALLNLRAPCLFQMRSPSSMMLEMRFEHGTS